MTNNHVEVDRKHHQITEDATPNNAFLPDRLQAVGQ